MGCHLTCSKNFYTKIICGGSSGNDSITWTLISTFGMDSKRSAQSAIRGEQRGGGIMKKKGQREGYHQYMP